MKEKLLKVLPMALVMLLVLSFTGCGEKSEPAVEKEKPGKEPTKEVLSVKPGDEVLAPFFDVDMFSAKWALAKIATPASEKTKGKYEVQFLIGTPDLGEGEKRWVKDIVWKSHPTKKEELKVGMIIIAAGNNSEDPSEARTDTWRKGVISSLDELHKNLAEVEFYHNLKEEPFDKEKMYLHNIYIIDEPAHGKK